MTHKNGSRNEQDRLVKIYPQCHEQLASPTCDGGTYRDFHLKFLGKLRTRRLTFAVHAGIIWHDRAKQCGASSAGGMIYFCNDNGFMSKNQSKLNVASLTTLADAMFYWARTTPDAPAWWLEQDGDFRAISWKEIEQAALFYADQLVANLKIQVDENAIDSRLSDSEHRISARLMSYLPNGIEWAIVDLACQILGIVHVPIDRRIPEGSLNEYRTSIKPIGEVVAGFRFDELLRHSSESAEVGRQLKHNQSKRSSVATILYTSGTSGRAEGVMLSHDNLIRNAWAKLEAVPQSPHDRRLNILPFAHAYARTCELSTWLLSGSSMCCVANYNQMLRVAPLYKPTLINAVPYHFQKLRENILSQFTPTASSEKAVATMVGESLRTLAAGGRVCRSTSSPSSNSSASYHPRVRFDGSLASDLLQLHPKSKSRLCRTPSKRHEYSHR